MIIEPFRVNGFSVVDNQDLSKKDQVRVTKSIRDAFWLLPEEYKCEFLGSNPDGDFPIMRFGFYNGTRLIGAWWMGCNETQEGHTEKAARIVTRPSPGIIDSEAGEFWKGSIIVKISQYLLESELQVRGGGTVQVVGINYTVNDDLDNTGRSSIVPEISSVADANSDIVLTKVRHPKGGFAIRATKRAPDVVPEVKTRRLFSWLP